MDDQIMQFLVGGASVKTCLFNSVRAKLVLKLASSKVKYKIHLYLIPRAKVIIYNGIEQLSMKIRN